MERYQRTDHELFKIKRSLGLTLRVRRSHLSISAGTAFGLSVMSSFLPQTQMWAYPRAWPSYLIQLNGFKCQPRVDGRHIYLFRPASSLDFQIGIYTGMSKRHFKLHLTVEHLIFFSLCLVPYSIFPQLSINDSTTYPLFQPKI